MTSLRGQLLWAIAGVVLLTLAIFAVATYWLLVMPTEQELAEQQMLRSAARAREPLRATIAAIERVVLVSREQGLRGLLSIDDPVQFNRAMLPILTTMPQTVAFILAREDGRELFLIKTRDGWDNRVRNDQRFGAGRQQWHRWNGAGALVTTETLASDYDPRTRPWYTAAMQGARDDVAHWTGAYRFFTLKVFGTTVAARWTDPRTGVRYTFACDVTLENLSRLTASIPLGHAGRVAVLAEDGLILGAPRPAPGDAIVGDPALRPPDAAGHTVLASAWSAWEKAGRAHGRPFGFQSGGVAWLGLFDTIRFGERSAVIATYAPRAEFAVTRPWHVGALGGIALLSLGLVMAFAHAGSRRLSRTLEALAGESDRIGNLDLDRPVSVSTRARELAAVVTAQERMRSALLMSTRNLEQQIAVRTREIAEREAFMTALLESSPSGMIVTSRAGTIRYVSPKWLELSGYTEAELTGRPVAQLYAEPGNREAILRRLDEHGRVRDHEVLFHRKDGSPIWTLLNASSVDIASEVQIVSWVHDLTERRAAAERIRALAEELQLLFAHVQVGIAVTRDVTVLRHNAKFAEIFGYASTDALGGVPVSRHIPRETLEAVQREVLDRLGRGETYDGEWPGWRRDGAAIRIHVVGKAFIVDGVRTDVWMVDDVTERHRAAEALREATRVAEEATRAKGEFLANMSHEIRTPMNAIIGMSHLALETGLPPQQQAYVLRIQSSAKLLLGIVDDILDSSKIEAGMLGLEHIPFSLDDVLDGLVNMVATAVEDKGLELMFDRGPDVPRGFVGDPLRLGQVLINLAGNAVKFTSAGEVVVTVQVDGAADAGVTLRFAVRDTGIGMTEEQLARLFRPFAQGDSSITRQYGGSGLGLSICRHLVERMGGRIWAESTPGAGSSFFFTVHLEVDHAAERPASRRPVGLDAIRVLIVDDSAAARAILGRMVQGLGCDVVEVRDGREALAVLEKAASGRPVDLVLLDCAMPEPDGFQTLAAIRSDGARYGSPKIVMVTAHRRQEVAQRRESVALDGFLLKPVTEPALCEAIVAALGGAPARVASHASGARPAGLARIRGARVLLVEDNEINRQVAGEILARGGIVVVSATTGEEAVAAVERGGDGHYDAVLMDVQMPVMDGFEATRRIRALPCAATLPIIAATAHASADGVAQCLAAGMTDHVSKPLVPSQLLAVLARCIPARPGRRDDPGPSDPGAAASEPPARRDVLAGLPGIDVEDGLDRVGGNTGLYRRILVRLRADFADASAGVRTLLAAGDVEAAMRLAHSASGVAGNVGARDLQAAARALEHALRSGARSNLPLVLDAFDIALRTVVDGLAHLDGGTGPGSSGVRFSDRQDRLPARLVEDMRSAVVRADLDRLVELIAEVDPIDGDMARGLSAGVESLDYVLLRRLLGMDEGTDRGRTR